MAKITIARAIENQTNKSPCRRLLSDCRPAMDEPTVIATTANSISKGCNRP